VLGGCSSINGMIYMRGQARDYDGWAAAVADATGAGNTACPTSSATKTTGAAATPGTAPARSGGSRSSGCLGRCSTRSPRRRARPASRPATTSTAGNNEGVGYFEVNQKTGVRWNTSKAFLRPVVGRPNLQVWTGATTSRVLVEGGRAVGVEVLPVGGGEMLRPRAAQAVVLAAGAVGTPQILQLSGLGPAALLQSLGIPLVQDLPGVGENLQDHLQIRAVFAVEGVRTLNTQAASLWGKAAIGLEYLLRRSGPMSMAPSQLGAFTRSAPGLEWPNVEYHVQPLSLDAFGEPLHRYNAFTASVCNLNPTARGHVRIASPDPLAAPRIQANYLSTAEDRQVAADSLRLTRRIAAMPALAKYRPREVKPGLEFQSDDELARLAGDIGTTIFHPVGTCRMGRADDRMPCSTRGSRVRRRRGLPWPTPARCPPSPAATPTRPR
jgi:choline dehydrogenase